MSAKNSNVYAQKWTKEKALALIEKAHGVIDEECYFLSEVAVKVGVYPYLFSYLAKKFSKEEKLIEAIQNLKAKCESIITRKTAMRSIVPSLGIFILKSYHGQSSKIDQEDGGLQSPISFVSDQEGLKLIEALTQRQGQD